MFKSIKAKNLFSWETLDYEVKTGISQISGYNFDDNSAEGSGKSSVPNILCWTLYGKIPKDVKIDDVVKEGAKGGYGEVELDTGYKIKRSRSPNILQIITPTNVTNCGKDAKETQLMINKLIGMDFDAFCQTVYFAQNYTNKFISANELDKAKILSEVQDLTIFDKARKKTQELIKQEEAALSLIARETTALEAEVSKKQSNAQLIIEFIERFEEDKTKKSLVYTKKLEVLNQRKTELQSQNPQGLEALNNDIEHADLYLEALAKQRVDASTKIGSIDMLKQQKASLTRTLAGFEPKKQRLEARREKQAALLNKLESPTKGPGNCPTCGQAATKEALQDHKKHLNQQKAEALAELEATTKELAELQVEEKEVQVALSQISIPSAEVTHEALDKITQEMQTWQSTKKQKQKEIIAIEKTKVELKEVSQQITSLTNDIKTLAKTDCNAQLQTLENLDTEISNLKVEIEKNSKKIEKLMDKLSNLEILKSGFKEVKQYVFQSLLKELSIKSTAFAADLFEVPIKIEFFNEEEEGGVSKIKTLVTLDGKERSLGLYSGGQFKRIELSVDLALASIVANRSQNAINFRILDEPLKDLSGSSKEKVVELLRRLKGNTLIIEHDLATKAIIHNVFNIEYRNGTSYAA